MSRAGLPEPGTFRLTRIDGTLVKVTVTECSHTESGARFVLDVELVPEPAGRAVDLSNARVIDPDTIDDDFEEA